MSIKFLKNLDSQPKKNLVIVRAGLSSLHNQYFYESFEKKSWDRMILSYVEPNPLDLEKSEYVVQGGLTKWTDFSELINIGFFSNSGYEYILLADDDVVPSNSKTINLLFDIAKKFSFEICQPALTHDSYHSWYVTLQSPAFHLRYTNFVECMCPVFSANSIKILEKEIAIAKSGCGLDLIFSEYFEPSKNLIGIIDDVTFKHTKPIDLKEGAFYKHLREHGIDATRETFEYMLKFNIFQKDILTFGGISKKQTIKIPVIE